MLEIFTMATPQAPVTLTPEQIAELNKKLSKMRHDINGKLQVVLMGPDMIRMKPELADKYLDQIRDCPNLIVQLVKQFSAEFEAALGINRPEVCQTVVTPPPPPASVPLSAHVEPTPGQT